MKNKDGETIASAITGVDIHDIARAACTYGVRRFFIVTPLSDQRGLAEKIIEHWVTGVGSLYNPDRKEALLRVKIVPDMSGLRKEIEKDGYRDLAVVATSAADSSKRISFSDLARMAEDTGRAFLIALGTGWGLTDEFMRGADFILEPIKGAGNYNHLSVRCAAAVILDRLVRQIN